jgi:hypothetical protein
MELPAFIPEELRQLARFVPGTGWDAIEWKPLLGAMRQLSWRFVSGRGVAPLRAELQTQLPDLVLVDTNGELQPLHSLRSKAKRRAAGDRILELYFAQWRSPRGLFLDLRPGRFGTVEGATGFAPNGLWIQLRPEFREGMLALYRSFYSSEESAFEQALLQMGMLRQDLPAPARAELKQLLHAHFGLEQRAQRFAIDRFKASFDELFAFFIAHDYKLHSDFVFVGFYLITLYLSLEHLDQPHDVRAICAAQLG